VLGVAARGGIGLQEHVSIPNDLAPILVIDLPDEAATARLAAGLAALVRAHDIIALRGDLGAGKTSFARAFIRALSDEAQEVPSPTFSLVQTYDTAQGEPLWHFDLYRLSESEEALELGIEDAFAEGITLIEWPERLGDLLPKERLDLVLEAGPEPTSRKVSLYGWPSRLTDWHAP